MNPNRSLPSSPAVAVGIVALLVLIGLAPFVYLLDIVPQSRDAVLWIDRGDPAGAWAEWAFSTRQFQVTLRPLVAVSFTVTRRFADVSPFAHRLVDLVLHGLVIALPAAVVRRWSPHATVLGMVAASLVVAAHPLAGYVVPDLARRSYSMTTALILLTLLVVPRTSASPSLRRGAGVLASAIAAGAALSHEVGYLAFALAALAAVPPTQPGLTAWTIAIRRQAWFLGSSLAFGTGLLTWRASVMGGLGGYHGGSPAPWTTGRSTIEALFPLEGLRLQHEPASLMALGFGVAVLTVAIVVHARNRGRDPVLRVGLAWILGAIALFVPQPVWFLRQVYTLVAPLALVVGSLLGAGRPGMGRAAAGATVFALLAQVPQWTGRAGLERERQQRTSTMMTEIDALAAKLPEGAELALVVPRWRLEAAWGRRSRGDTRKLPYGLRTPAIYVKKRHPGRRVHMALVAFGELDETDPFFETRWSGDTLELTVQGGRSIASLVDPTHVEGDETTVHLTFDGHEPTWVYVHDGVKSRHFVVSSADPM